VVRADELVTLEGTTTVPEDFSLVVPQAAIGECVLPPGETLELRWTRSSGAWAYVGETFIGGLAEVLAAGGSEAELDEDPLYLLGLSVSASDTTMAFPAEFGVFDRFDLDRDVSVLLQAGLPEGTEADVTISAVDRNYVNWIRGGSFNPSGTIRVPSLHGEGGSGVIGSYVSRRFRVRTTPGPGRVECRPGTNP
jgi:hypothetical protein